MKTWIEIHDAYLKGITGASLTAIAEASRIAAQVFCERTRAWRQKLDPVVTIKGQAEYAYPIPLDAELVRVMEVKLDGECYPILLADQRHPGARGIVPQGLRSFIIYPEPADGQEIVIDVALAPANTATGIDDVLFAKYARIIAKGAKAELMRESNKPYSDMAGAIDMRTAFQMDIDQVLTDLATKYGNAPLRVRAHFC